MTELETLRKYLAQAWALGANHERPSFDQLKEWRTALGIKPPRSPEEVLRSIVTDVEAMRAKSGQEHSFGPFTFFDTLDSEVWIDWPNLSILIGEAKQILGPFEVQERRQL